MTDWMVMQLRESFRPTSSAIVDRVRELSAFLPDISNRKLPKWCPVDVRHFIAETAVTLDLWARVCRELL